MMGLVLSVLNRSHSGVRVSVDTRLASEPYITIQHRLQTDWYSICALRLRIFYK